MSNTTKNLVRHPFGKDGRDILLPVDGGSHIYEGSLVSQLSATAMLVPGSTASSGNAVGVAVHEIDNTSGSDGDKRCRVEYDRIFEFANGSTTDACSEATPLFSVVYMGDDHTIFDNDGGGSLKAAGRFCGMSEDGKVRVFVGAAIADLGDALADAVDVAIADAGTFTAQTTVEGATQEIYQHLESVQKQVNIPITAALEVATGALLTVFADGASSVPGTQLTDSKAVSVRWNNHATPAAIAITVAMPQELDDAANVVFHALVSKIGATVGDATKLTVGAFEQTVGALHDADTDFGGDTDAVVGNATSKTVTELTLTLALADIHATPSAITFTIKPKAGTLGTDDFCLHAAWLEYKGKLLTS
jgi:hypothetical protein